MPISLSFRFSVGTHIQEEKNCLFSGTNFLSSKFEYSQNVAQNGTSTSCKIGPIFGETFSYFYFILFFLKLEFLEPSYNDYWIFCSAQVYFYSPTVRFRVNRNYETNKSKIFLAYFLYPSDTFRMLFSNRVLSAIDTFYFYHIYCDILRNYTPKSRLAGVSFSTLYGCQQFLLVRYILHLFLLSATITKIFAALVLLHCT